MSPHDRFGICKFHINVIVRPTLKICVLCLTDVALIQPSALIVITPLKGIIQFLLFQVPAIGPIAVVVLVVH